jgi:hypothetical protein
LAGPASAGAIVVAVSAAQISNAVRKEANSLTVKLRQTAEYQTRITCEYSRLRPLRLPVSRGILGVSVPSRMPPALVVAQGFTRPASGVNPNRSFQR